jgi:hypothetical protein
VSVLVDDAVREISHILLEIEPRRQLPAEGLSAHPA